MRTCTEWPGQLAHPRPHTWTGDTALQSVAQCHASVRVGTECARCFAPLWPEYDVTCASFPVRLTWGDLCQPRAPASRHRLDHGRAGKVRERAVACRLIRTAEVTHRRDQTHSASGCSAIDGGSIGQWTSACSHRDFILWFFFILSQRRGKDGRHQRIMMALRSLGFTAAR